MAVGPHRTGTPRRPRPDYPGIVMTKKDIVRTIAEETGETQELTRRIVQGTFDQIIEVLLRERRIELRNFGVFEVKTRAARRARNPDTGKEVMVPQRQVVTFKPGKEMAARIRNLPSGDTGRPTRTSSPNDPDTADPNGGNIDVDRSENAPRNAPDRPARTDAGLRGDWDDL